MSMLLRLTNLLLALALVWPLAARAQNNLFTPAVFVNDRVITYYEIEQNRLFLALLRQPGDLDTVAVERLIEDRLRLDAAQALGIDLSPEELEAGLAEFSQRANLSTEEFVAALAQAGVSEGTFRSFVEAGLLWRQVVRTRFGPRAQVSEDEIDRALALASRQSGVQVLISELVLRADNPQAQAEAERVVSRLAGQFVSEGAFAAEARERSVAPTRGAGGRLDWLPLSNLPPQIASQVIGLAPGQVSQPFPVTGAIVLFYLRDLQETGLPEENVLAVDWAELDVGSAEEALEIKGEIDTCDDLYGIAQDWPEERLRRETLPSAEIPNDVALEIARLDDNEVSETFSRGGRPVLLMLCGRTYEIAGAGRLPPEDGEVPEGEEAPPPPGPSREEIRNQLLNQRLASYADGYLAELRAEATIRYR